MMQLSLEKPEYLYLLFLVPALGMLLWSWRKKREKLAGRFVSRTLYDKISLRKSDRFGIRLALVLTSVALMIIALANPQLPGKTEKTTKKSADIILAFDVSRSMNAQDIAPDRLNRAKLWATDLVTELRSERIGLIVFAGAAYIYMPLTDDYNAAIEFINGISAEMASFQGTAIGDAIQSAEKIFEGDAGKSRGLVIISDGEDHDSGALKAADNASRQGIVITSIGVGTERGGLIPEMSDGGTNYKLGEDGQPVRSRLNAQILKQVAAAAQGRYYNLDDQKAALKGVLAMADGLTRGVYDSLDTSTRVSLFSWFLWPAFILITIEYLMSLGVFYQKRNKALKKLATTGTAVFLLMFASTAVLQAQNARRLMMNGNEAYREKKYDEAAKSYDLAARKKPGFNSLYNEANALYHQNKYKEAAEKNMEAYGKAQTSQQKAITSYNLGNSFFKSGEYAKAIDAYKQALRNDPTDLDAKKNLTKALQEKQKQDEKKKQQQNRQEKQQEQQNDQQQQNKEQKQASQGDQSQNNNNGQPPGQQESQEHQQPTNLSRQEADNLLRILKEDEKNTRARMMKRQQAGEPRRQGKDW